MKANGKTRRAIAPQKSQSRNTCRERLVTMRVTHTRGVAIFADLNTTIAYCRYSEAGEIEYIFVNPAHRRKGYAKQLLSIVEERLQIPLRFQTPISPLGSHLLDSYNERQALKQRRNAALDCGAAAHEDRANLGRRSRLLLKRGRNET
jgi:GNAT superfamily N-acetyltransferase